MRNKAKDVLKKKTYYKVHEKNNKGLNERRKRGLGYHKLHWERNVRRGNGRQQTIRGKGDIVEVTKSRRRGGWER